MSKRDGDPDVYIYSIEDFGSFFTNLHNYTGKIREMRPVYLDLRNTLLYERGNGREREREKMREREQASDQ